MNVSLELIGVTLVVKLDGEIDHHASTYIREEIDRCINLNNVKNLVLDFDKVTFMDSSGIGLVLGRYKEIKARGGKTLLVRAKPQVNKILELSGVKKILECG